MAEADALLQAIVAALSKSAELIRSVLSISFLLNLYTRMTDKWILFEIL